MTIMTIKGVLFDFSGTLLRIESAESWLRAVLTEAELTLPEPELQRLAAALETAGALPGGSSPPRSPTSWPTCGPTETWTRQDTARPSPVCPAKSNCPTRDCTTRCTNAT